MNLAQINPAEMPSAFSRILDSMYLGAMIDIHIIRQMTYLIMKWCDRIFGPIDCISGQERI